MIFINSPFAILDEAFRSLYPDKKYKACIERNGSEKTEKRSRQHRNTEADGFGQKTGCRRKAKMCSCGLSISGSGTIRNYSRR